MMSLGSMVSDRCTFPYIPSCSSRGAGNSEGLMVSSQGGKEAGYSHPPPVKKTLKPQPSSFRPFFLCLG